MATRRQIIAGGLATGLAFIGRPAFAATDQLRVGLPAEPPHLDPTAPGATPSTFAISAGNIFEGLVRLAPDGTPQPNLAKSWTLSPDGRSCTFVLEDGARFHDGTAFDGDHVVFTLQRLLNPASQNPRRDLFASIAQVVSPDPATVVLTLSKPDPALLFNLGRPEAAIVAPESADQNRTVPIGTGPFAFVEWDAGQRVLLERNEDYFGPHPRMIDITFSFVPEAQAAAALLAGQLDAYPIVSDAGAFASLAGSTDYALLTGKGPDGTTRFSAWSRKLDGVSADQPVAGAPLLDVRWAGAPAPAREPGSDTPPVEDGG